MKIKLYVKTTCPYCIKAIQWFKNYNLEPEIINVDDYEQREALYDHLALRSPFRTVPQIIVDGQRIGGYSDLLKSDFARSVQAQAQSDKL